MPREEQCTVNTNVSQTDDVQNEDKGIRAYPKTGSGYTLLEKVDYVALLIVLVNREEGQRISEQSSILVPLPLPQLTMAK